MPKGRAVVEHRVSTDPVYCEFDAPDDGFCERSVCSYLRSEFKSGKVGERSVKLPRCSLFKVWLEKDFHTKRCDRCKKACGEEISNE